MGPDYNGIIKRFSEARPELQTWSESVQSILRNDKLIAESLEPAIIKGRVKSEASLRKKVRKKHSPPDRVITPTNLLHEIEDLCGVRVVLAHKQHVPLIIERIQNLTQFQVISEHHYVWHPEEVRSVERSGISAESKETSYCSRHFIVCQPGVDLDADNIIKCEIQVRTLLEEAIFENEHRVVYKGRPGPITSLVMTRLVQLLETSDLLLADLYNISESERRKK